MTRPNKIWRVWQNIRKKKAVGDLKEFLELETRVVEYNPVGGSSYIPLPEKLRGKMAIVNVKNEDNECFKWSVTRALNPVDKNSERISKELRKQSEELDWSMLTFPVVSSHNSIETFERANDIAVNIFGYENGSKKEGIRQGVYPRRVTKTRSSKMLDLLLISDDEKQHYCVIKSMSRLLSSQTIKHNGKRWFCKHCLKIQDDSLNNHLEYCENNEAVRTIFAKEPFTHFKNHYKYMRVPFAVYADFECFMEKLSNARPSEDSQYTMKYQKHQPSGFCLYIVSPFFEFEPIMYTKKSEDFSSRP